VSPGQPTEGAFIKARATYLRTKVNGDRDARRAAKLALRAARAALDAEIAKDF